MPFLNRARLFANKMLAPAGFAVERVKKANPWSNPTVVTRVGRFTIQVPRANPIATVYQDNPHYMGQMAVLVSFLKKKYPNLSAIDVGANVGDTACIIRTAAEIPLVCIEGDDYTFQLLQQNIRQFEGVTAHKLFLGEKTASIAATFEKGGWNTTIKPGHSDGSQAVEIVSLDSFLASRPEPAACKLLKIDAEGFDCSIIRGAANFLQKSRPVVMFEFNRDNMEAIGETGLATLSLLRQLGYSQATFHDCNGRFFTGASLSQEVCVRDLLDYADGKLGSIYYFDLTVFHEGDSDVAHEFITAERARRPKPL